MNIQFAAFTTLFFSSAALLLTSCSSGNSGVTYEDFRSRTSALAGGNAIDCGNADIGKGNEQNACVGSAYVSQSAAFATYDNQGTDSRSATGLAVTEDSRVYRLFFDGDPSGGGSSSNGDISVLECTNASLSGIIDGQPTELFNCD